MRRSRCFHQHGCHRDRLRPECAQRLCEKTTRHLAKQTGKPIVLADDLFAATWDQHAFVAESAALRSLSIKLSKIASDLILLSSGPRAGLGEINLPPMQPGSSIMPGKVNPVIAELMNLVSFRVIGNDVSVTLAARNGQLQLNAYEPLEAIAILDSQRLLTNAMRTLASSALMVSRSTQTPSSLYRAHRGHCHRAEPGDRL